MVGRLGDLENSLPVAALLVVSSHSSLLFDTLHGPDLLLGSAQLVHVGHQTLNWLMHYLIVTIHLLKSLC